MSNFNRRVFLSRLLPLVAAPAALASLPEPAPANDVIPLGAAVPPGLHWTDMSYGYEWDGSRVERYVLRPLWATLVRWWGVEGAAWRLAHDGNLATLPAVPADEARKLAEYKLVEWARKSLNDLEKLAFAPRRQ